MALTNAFNEAVDSGNVRRVRIMMKDSLLNDPSFKQFYEMSDIASALKELYDYHDGRAFNLDKTMWNDSYMNELMVQVVGNFSKERIEHLQKVVQYLRPVSVNTKSSSSENLKSTSQTHSSYKQQKYHDQKNGKYKGVQIATGVVAGAVVGGAVAAVASMTVIGGAAVGALAGGVVAYVATKGGE